MNSESNPLESRSAASNSSSPTVLTLSEIGKDSAQWTLTLHPHHLALAEAPDPQPYIIVREEVMKSATLMESMRAFILQKPKKITFKLAPDAVETLAEWIGRPVLAGIYLKRRYSWILPIAVIWVIGAMPIKGNPNTGADAIPFDPVGLIMGLTLIVSWAVAKWRPHPVLFLVDSLWFLVMGGRLVMDVFDGRSKGWLVLVFFLFWMVLSGLKHFLRFKGTRIQPSKL